MPDEYLAAMNVEEETPKRVEALRKPTPRSSTLVVEVNSRVVGFSMTGPLRKSFGDYDGEVYAIYVFQDFQNHGIGSNLFQASLSDLHKNGFSSCLVWTLKANNSVNFYKKMGGVFETEDQMVIGKSLPIVVFGWNGLSGR